MGKLKKERNASKTSDGPSLSNVTKIKGVNFYRDANKVRKLNILKGGKPTRNSQGKIIKEAVYQKRLDPGTQARVEPNRRWFENTRVVGQKELSQFREAIETKLNDPYSFVLRTKSLPMGLIDSSKPVTQVKLECKNEFAFTFVC